jgi:hypothetical protein
MAQSFKFRCELYICPNLSAVCLGLGGSALGVGLAGFVL